ILRAAKFPPSLKPITTNERLIMFCSQSLLARATGCASLAVALLFGTTHAVSVAGATPPDDGELRIICFGAHPDDCEIKASGVAGLWAAKGHHVKFVSVSNGDIGHWREAGGPLALRRKSEMEAADKILGITPEVFDIHDGEIMVTLEQRRMVTRAIREWKA